MGDEEIGNPVGITPEGDIVFVKPPPEPEIKPAMTAEEWAEELAMRDADGLPLRLKDFKSFRVHSDAGSWGMEGKCPRCSVTVRVAEHAWWRPECDCDIWWENDGVASVSTDPHALSALCLHNQPFGFTQEMADGIRTLIWESGSAFCPACTYHGSLLPRITEDGDGVMQADNPRPSCPECGWEPVGYGERRELADQAAQRIVALLPPREMEP